MTDDSTDAAPPAGKPFAGEHACRLQDPDQFDTFRRENDAVQIDGKSVDFVFGIESGDDGASELASIRYPLDEGWDGEDGEAAAREHCTEQDSIEFEPAEESGRLGSVGCAGCGTLQDNGMTDTTADGGTGTDAGTVQKTVTPDGVVTRDVDGDEVEMLRVPITSTRPDRDGDAFSEQALRGMVEQIREQQPHVFDDHGRAGGGMFGAGYSARETIGAQMDAEVEEADDGNFDLFAYINPDGTHPDGEGERMLKQVRDEKQPIKFSVGFGILQTAEDLPEDDQPDRATDVPGRLFMRTDLMETSRVGIPANTDASVTMAAKFGGRGEGLDGRVPVALMSPEEMAAIDRDVVGAATPTRVDGQPEATVGSGVDSKSDSHATNTMTDDDSTTTDTDTGTKAPDDIGPADFNEFVASHYEGLDAADVTDALGEAGGEYVGAVDVPEHAAFTASVVDQDTGTVQDQFDEWMGDAGGDDDGDGNDGDGEGEEDDATPDGTAGAGGTQADDDLRERYEALQAEVEDLRASINDGVGDPETSNTTASTSPTDTDDEAGTGPDDEASDDTTEEPVDHDPLL